MAQREQRNDFSRPRAEYGGYLPLELNRGSEFFSKYEGNLLRFNSVKAALDKILTMTKPEVLCVPLYYCPSTTEALRRSGIRIQYYHVGEDLLPEPFPDTAGTAILLVNYFGILDDPIRTAAMSYKNATVLLDQAHAFFCPPLMQKNIYNFYSARKFFGVPDGSYVIGNAVYGGETEEHFAGTTAYYLLKSYEQGTNAAYAEKKQADAEIAAEYAPMSKLARGLLQNVNYENVQTCRLRNFVVLHTAFAHMNRVTVSAVAPAYVYPFLCENGKKLKEQLVNERIYVPTLWNSELLSQEGTAFERSMSRNAVFLPVDQRYGDEDTAFLVRTVEDMLW